MKKNKLIALFAGLSLAFVGSAALAAPSPDTLLVAGYDSDSMAVLYGVSSIDADDAETATLDCTLSGDFVYEADDEADAEATQVDVTGLWTKDKDAADGKGDPAEFYFEGDDDQEGDSVLYGTETTDDVDGAEECALTSVKIEPNGNGEINHGKVVSTFAKLLKGGNGCLIRHFAQSDFGKGDYDVADGESVDEVLEVTLQSFETACNKKVKSDPDDDDSESHGKSNAPGQEKKNQADKADKGGKSNAPGQLKKAQGDDNDSND